VKRLAAGDDLRDLVEVARWRVLPTGSADWDVLQLSGGRGPGVVRSGALVLDRDRGREIEPAGLNWSGAMRIADTSRSQPAPGSRPLSPM
jgi:hypothetical protein